ncbi:sulfatase-like hydrolase/transferase [Alienimonas californiensis]|uniref:Sulfatase n=1 Tax=Alienimonas californiensis TaxID=2527989 RepID=A0A517P428_9PLAN|nr:sulfatase-like hydrolase/transferase [Alienimonas californiensis]QDT14129.1 Sulfatase [Alienimonas californiensis]
MTFHLRAFPALALAAVALFGGRATAAERPNFVWIVSEDNSVHYLRHFFEGGAEAPAIEALAADGLTFNHAFSNAPVCSVARTTLATMCYGPRIGTQFHRRDFQPPLPNGQPTVYGALRRAGYYVTNNSKTDFNFVVPEDTWDESSKKASWKKRPDAEQPFFHMQSHAQTHESSLHFKKDSLKNRPSDRDLATVTPPPYLPDTPLVRGTQARYLDNHLAIDEIVARTVADLEAAGVLEDTFVFYFGDHGGVLPRGKGYVYDSGLHVPLVVRLPKNFAHLAQGFERGTRVDGFVSFVDFGPTVLRLAGVEPEGTIDGAAFLGPGVTPEAVAARQTSFGYADRMDEKYDFVRTLRRGRYRYVRAFQPWLPDGLQNNYRYNMLAYQQWRELSRRGELNATQAAFFEPKPIEALYDCEADPHEVRNLAADPAHAETLHELRSALRETMLGLPDLSFYPESVLAERAAADPAAFGQAHRQEIARLSAVADLALRPFDEAEPGLRAALSDANPMVRYWAAMVCTAFGERAASLAPLVRPLLEDDSPVVRLRATEFLGRIGAVEPQPLLATLLNETDSPIFAAEVLNTIVWFADHVVGTAPVDPSVLKPQVRGDSVARRLEYLNAPGAAAAE